ncbi:MAG: ParB N-terminal domain-containing protein [Candidatus Pacebacteria bacterium]|nr:ParB N-terminal domain-containing protein [Candidatus Paceibacterota bacterium]
MSNTNTTVPGNGATAENEQYEVVSNNVVLPLAHVKMFEGQPRQYFDQPALRDLAASIQARGQQNPIKVMKLAKPIGLITYEAVDGQRRYMAHELLKRLTLVATIVKVKDRKDQFIQSCMANFGQYPHTVLEKILAVKRLREECDQKPSEIATVFVCNVTYIYEMMRAGELDAPILDRLDPKRPEEERLTFPVAVLLGALPRDMQHEILPKVTGRIPVYKARDIIHTAAKAKGIELGRGQNARTPKNDWRMVVSFAKRTSEQAGIFAGKNNEYFDMMCATRTKREVEALLAEIEQGIQKLQSLKALLKKRATDNKTVGGASNNAWLLEKKNKAELRENTLPPPKVVPVVKPPAPPGTAKVETKVVQRPPQKEAMRPAVVPVNVESPSKAGRRHLTHKQRIELERQGGFLKKKGPQEFRVPVDVKPQPPPQPPAPKGPTPTELRDRKRGYSAGTKIPPMPVD